MEIDKELKKYIEENIFPKYANNDLGHNLNHIMSVIERSFKFASQVSDINMNMVYTIAAMHDIGVYIDRDNHEKISADILLNDTNLRNFFNDEEIRIMAEAVSDHRASLKEEPRSIYGKVVSSADRNVDVNKPVRATFTLRMKMTPGTPIEEIMEESRQHIIEKFGRKGYAKGKMYFEDLEYKKFLEDIVKLAEDEEAFKKRYIEINKLEDVFNYDDINKRIRSVFYLMKETNPEMSLDQLLYATYKEGQYKESFEDIKKRILRVCGIS